MQHSAVEIRGGKYVSPKSAAEAAKRVGVEDSDIAFKLAGLYHDLASLGNPTASARNRSIFLGGSKQGDIVGQVARMVAQFKTFAAGMYDVGLATANVKEGANAKNYRDVIMGRGGSRANLMQLAASLTAIGFASEYLRAVASGKETPDPRSLDTWKKSMVRGGAAGLLGDVILSESRNYGKDLWDDAAGPTGEMYKDAGELALDTAGMAFGGDGPSNKRIDRFIKRHGIPNHPIIEPVVKGAYYNSIRLLLDPDMLDRRERRKQREPRSF